MDEPRLKRVFLSYGRADASDLADKLTHDLRHHTIAEHERYEVWKVQPLVDWDAKRVDAYIHVNEIPYNPLHDAGYPSIGCIPCTRPVSRDEDERAGRWADSDKIECGIHTSA